VARAGYTAARLSETAENTVAVVAGFLVVGIVVAGVAVAVAPLWDIRVAGIAVVAAAVTPFRDIRAAVRARWAAARAVRQQSRRNRNRTLYFHLTLFRNFYSSWLSPILTWDPSFRILTISVS